jgi:hypothetical protein
MPVHAQTLMPACDISLPNSFHHALFLTEQLKPDTMPQNDHPLNLCTEITLACCISTSTPGVEQAFYSSNRVFTTSFHKYNGSVFPGTGKWTDCGEGHSENFCLNLPLADGIDDESYLTIFREIMDAIITSALPSSSRGVEPTRLGVTKLASSTSRLPHTEIAYGSLKMSTYRCWSSVGAVIRFTMSLDVGHTRPPYWSERASLTSCLAVLSCVTPVLITFCILKSCRRSRMKTHLRHYDP